MGDDLDASLVRSRAFLARETRTSSASRVLGRIPAASRAVSDDRSGGHSGFSTPGQRRKVTPCNVCTAPLAAVAQALRRGAFHLSYPAAFGLASICLGIASPPISSGRQGRVHTSRNFQASKGGPHLVILDAPKHVGSRGDAGRYREWLDRSGWPTGLYRNRCFPAPNCTAFRRPSSNSIIFPFCIAHFVRPGSRQSGTLFLSWSTPRAIVRALGRPSNADPVGLGKLPGVEEPRDPLWSANDPFPASRPVQSPACACCSRAAGRAIVYGHGPDFPHRGTADIDRQEIARLCASLPRSSHETFHLDATQKHGSVILPPCVWANERRIATSINDDRLIRLPTRPRGCC